MDLNAPYETLIAHSRFARMRLEADAALRADVLQLAAAPIDVDSRVHALGEPRDSEQTAKALRRLRARVFLALMARDLCARADLAEVFATMSALADRCVQYAVETAYRVLRDALGTPLGERNRPMPAIAVAMGKWGGEELNVSSDIDIVFLYPADGDIAGGVSHHEFFAELAKRTYALLSRIDDNGYVFRVDTRLRPYGESGPPVMTLGSLARYFLDTARTWERYAWLKARVVTPRELPTLDEMVRPFVYRGYRDYAAIAGLRAVREDIEREARKRGAADDIKLGAGGIREIEFIAQIFQLLRGNRERALQTRSTRAALEAIARRELMPAAHVDTLKRAYAFLRRLEHRIQYLDDAQTHRLPSGSDDRMRLARSMGLADGDALLEALAGHRREVAALYERVFAQEVANAPLAAPVATATAAPHGDAGERFLSSRALAGLADTQRDRLAAMVERLRAAVNALGGDDVVLARAVGVIEAIYRRANYLALLEHRASLLTALAQLARDTPALVSEVSRHPLLLEELDRAPQSPEDAFWQTHTARLADDLAHAGCDFELELDLLRHFSQRMRFELARWRAASGATPLVYRAALTRLAEALLDASLGVALARSGLARAPFPPFAVIGYGKLGGRELGPESDLDLVFLYDDSHEEAQQRYARLAQRLLSVLSVPTGAGTLYETDVRLRPDGAKGLLVSRFGAFEQYQTQRAWTWEHQALTRARFVAGNAVLGERFAALRESLLVASRDIAKLRADVAAMRDKMRRELTPRPKDDDLKHRRGGLVDFEFVAQFLVLAHSHAHPALARAIGSVPQVREAAAAGVIDASRAHAAVNAYETLLGLDQDDPTLKEEASRRVAETVCASVADLYARVLEST